MAVQIGQASVPTIDNSRQLRKGWLVGRYLGWNFLLLVIVVIKGRYWYLTRLNNQQYCQLQPS